MDDQNNFHASSHTNTRTATDTDSQTQKQRVRDVFFIQKLLLDILCPNQCIHVKLEMEVVNKSVRDWQITEVNAVVT